MSSTGRADVRDPEDHYQTPAWAVRAVLPYLGPSEELHEARILEPSAGRGAIVRELIAAGADPSKITAIEPSKERANVLAGLGVRVINSTFEDSWCEIAAHGRFDLVVMNPPFALAEEHIRLACSLLAPGGTVIALCRLAFLSEGQCRAKFRRDCPHDRLELVKRPSFTAEALEWLTDDDLRAMAVEKRNGDTETIAEVKSRLRRTDSCAYAWGLFGRGRGGRFWTHEEA